MFTHFKSRSTPNCLRFKLSKPTSKVLYNVLTRRTCVIFVILEKKIMSVFSLNSHLNFLHKSLGLFFIFVHIQLLTELFSIIKRTTIHLYVQICKKNCTVFGKARVNVIFIYGFKRLDHLDRITVMVIVHKWKRNHGTLINHPQEQYLIWLEWFWAKKAFIVEFQNQNHYRPKENPHKDISHVNERTS